MVMRDSRAAVLAALVMAATIAARAHSMHVGGTNIMVDTSGAAADASKQNFPAR